MLLWGLSILAIYLYNSHIEQESQHFYKGQEVCPKVYRVGSCKLCRNNFEKNRCAGILYVGRFFRIIRPVMEHLLLEFLKKICKLLPLPTYPAVA